MEIVRLKKEHYTQLVSLLNLVFTKQNGREMDFEREPPKAFVKDDDTMGKHLGIFDGEKLVAALGEYPLKARLLDEELLFYTVGNIATHPAYEGRGYMNALVQQAMRDITEKARTFQDWAVHVNVINGSGMSVAGLRMRLPLPKAT